MKGEARDLHRGHMLLEFYRICQCHYSYYGCSPDTVVVFVGVVVAVVFVLLLLLVLLLFTVVPVSVRDVTHTR